MSSSKLIFIFLGFILIAVVLLSSKRIATSLRTTFGRFLPATITKPSPTPNITITPTPTLIKKSVSVNNTDKVARDNTGEIPATGPAEIMWLILGGSAFAGTTLIRFSKEKH